MGYIIKMGYDLNNYILVVSASIENIENYPRITEERQTYFTSETSLKLMEYYGAFTKEEIEADLQREEFLDSSLDFKDEKLRRLWEKILIIKKHGIDVLKNSLLDYKNGNIANPLENTNSINWI